MIPFIDLQAQRQRIAPQIAAAVTRVIEHGGYVLGPEVAELESKLSEFVSSESNTIPHTVTCGSGTEGLSMVLMAWGVGSVSGGSAKDAVFCPAFTFVATAEVVALVGAVPFFVDVEEDSFNMSPASLAAAIIEAKNQGLIPRVVIAVDLFGQAANYSAILPIAAEAGLRVLCDAAQAFGGEVTLAGSNHRQKIGSVGHATVTSFFPAKPLGCYGEGGAIFSCDMDLVVKLKSIRAHGMGEDRYQNIRLGINGRLETIQAAILLQKLTIFADEIDLRQGVAAHYDRLLSDMGAVAKGVKLPRVAAGNLSAWAQYTVILPMGCDRARVIAELKSAEIPSMVYYPIPLNRQVAYCDFPLVAAGVGVSESLAERVLSLPMHPYLAVETQMRIAEVFCRAIF
ncbi:MAG: DegT/DnrJ/EryC1/StrS aminotransferase family protein [Candidatus Pacebacteria bacterium]|nr:DegT/DnrJ/EryC1/StrS aminotransferase family protein [Candidatus Paceibacterota bacterium]